MTTNEKVICRARDFYAIYMASCESRAWDGRACPTWDKLGEKVQSHWCTVALRSIQLQDVERELRDDVTYVGREKEILPNSAVIEHMGDDTRQEQAIQTWTEYSK